MSGDPNQALFFLQIPELNKLVCVSMTLHGEEEEPRTKQIMTCRCEQIQSSGVEEDYDLTDRVLPRRELVLLFADVLARPSHDCFTDITVVVAEQFFQRGILQWFAQRNHLLLGCPRRVLAGDLQSCLAYSLVCRLSPNWNKVGLHLVCGKDFLTDGGILNGVRLVLSSREGQLCMSVQATTMRLPPPTLQDFGLSQLVLNRLCSDPHAVLDSASMGGPIRCHVLPSMSNGEIMSFSRRLPPDEPFRTYTDLQNRWKRLYGYRLPEQGEDEVVYCNICFQPMGERLYTYPLSCIRLQPAERFPTVDLQGVLCSFMSDVRSRLSSVCGFAVQLSGKPAYPTVNLSTAASMQVQTSEQINLTTSVFIRPVQTELPSSSPTLHLSARISESQPDQAQNQYGSRAGVWPSSGISSCASASMSSLSGANVSSSVSSSLPVFQPSSCSLDLLTPPPESHFSSPPKVLPLFRNKNPSRHVNVALLKAQKQQSGGTEEKGRVTLPTLARKSPPLAPSLPPHPPPTVPCLRLRSKSHSSPAAPPKSQPSVTLLPSLTPRSKVKPNDTLLPSVTPLSKVKPSVTLLPATETKPEAIMKIQQEVVSGGDSAAKHEPQENKQAPEAADGSFKNLPSSSIKGVTAKKNAAALQHMEVEKMARSNQVRGKNPDPSSCRGRSAKGSEKRERGHMIMWFSK
uniref:Si:ch211-152c8.2 n=1 Tax=Oryzias melastigma TaxID=30732 RepID=A0A3B3B4E7_ORYME